MQLGAPYEQFRPTGADVPLSANPIATLTCMFDPDPDLSLRSVEDRRNYGAYLVGDTSGLASGDLLVGSETWFVSHIEPLRPASCVRCNHTVSISTPEGASSAGANDYGGRTSSTDQPLASGWPSSILAKSHIEMDPTRLPSDTKAAFFEVLLPIIPGLTITFGMRLTDETGQSYSVSSAEFSVLGWRLGVDMQTT